MAAQDDLIKQILSSSNTSKWTGSGYGSAEKNAADMAKILAGIGITDVKQFGKVPVYAPLQSAPAVEGVKIDDEGNYYKIVDGERQSVDPSKYKTVYGGWSMGENGPEFTPVDPSKIVVKNGQPMQDTGETTFGNKATGQAVPNTYSERQTGNFFGGTFEGKGNTGYGVQFDAKGNPVFYTQGASSNDLVNFLAQDPMLGTIAQIGAATFGGPLGSAALAAAMGKSPQDILKSAALSYAGNAAGNAVSGMGDITDVLGKTGAEIASNAAKQFVGSGGKVDPVAALLASGVNTGVGSLAGDLGLGNLTPAQQKMLSSGVMGLVNGQPLDKILMNAAVGAAMSPSGNAADMTVQQDPTGLNDFLSSIDKYKVDQNADATGPGYYDEITGKFISDPLGGLQNPLGPETGNFDPNQKWEYSLTKPGVWTNDQGEEIDLSYMPDRDTAMTGSELMERAGASPTNFKTNIKTPSAAATAPIAGAATKALASAAASNAIGPGSTSAGANGPSSGQSSTEALLNLMGSNNQLANIKSYKELFGHDLFTPGYVPPSAKEAEQNPDVNMARNTESNQDAASQSNSEEQFFKGGHVDDLSVDALLQILRS